MINILFVAPIDNTGYGVAARGYLKALAQRSDVKVALKDITRQVDNIPKEEAIIFDEMRRNSFPLGSCVPIQFNLPEWFHHDLYEKMIGITTFETDGLSSIRVRNCNKCGSIWVPCDFNVETFKHGGVSVPIRVIPYVSEEPKVVPPWRPKGVDDGTFMFLFVGDFNWRKGWDKLVSAFTQEFSRNENVALVMKFYGHKFFGEGTEGIIKAVKAYQDASLGKPKMTIISKFVSDDELTGLFWGCDAFAMPSRGEGWGLPLSEAMAMGKPTMGTRWGGNLQFMNNSNSFLVDVERLVPVTQQDLINMGYGEGQRLAEPSEASIRSTLRDIFTNRELAAAKGAKAKEDMKQFSPAKIAQLVVSGCEEYLACKN